MKTLNLLIAIALLFVGAQRQSLAGSATWATNPISGDWNTAANWTPQTVPNTSSDIATFAASNQRQVGFSAITGIGGIRFKPGAYAFTIISQPGDPVTFSGSGIVNNSGRLQTFLCEIEGGGLAGGFIFLNSASAADMTSFGGMEGSVFFFNDSTSAGSAAFDLGGGIIQSKLDFFDTSTAADSTINATQGVVSFFGSSNAANAHITVSGGASILGINESAHGGHVVVTCIGGSQYYGASMAIQQDATAEEGTYTTVGASTRGELGSSMAFTGNATAANGTFVIGGGLGAGLAATTLTFYDTTTAAAAHITAQGGVDGSDGGAIFFTKKSQGGTASITLSGNSELDISTHKTSGVTIGSLAGQGSVLLGANPLTIGSNNQNTTFSGVIQDGGSVTKIGSGTLKLSGASTYSGGTTVSAGTLIAGSESGGSATGTGPVQVNAGTLAGRGLIGGSVTIGTGSGAGAFLAPGSGASKPTALTIQGALTFKADGSYTDRLNLRRAKADQVSANGVTIESGAQFAFQGVANARLEAGKVFAVLNNTSANPIAGVFANLAEGATISAGRNTLQASYTGGDGNDLILTVVD